MGDIFISYSRHDAALIDQFVEVLAQAGMKAWVDREDIEIGNSWRVQIVEAIDGCDAFVLMLSASSVASANVHKEVILAQDSGRPTYVVMLEVVRLPAQIRYQLAGLQFINMPLMGFEKSAQKLVDSLKPHVKKIVPDGEGSHKQTELVIQGIDLSAFTAEKQEQLLAFISNLANTDPSQLKIANMTAGSVHVFVDMPAAVALQLKTLALNRDPRFHEFGIVSLRMKGSRQYVRIPSGSFSPNATSRAQMSVWMKLLVVLLMVIALGICFFSPALAPSSNSSATPSAMMQGIGTASLSPEPALPSTEVPIVAATDLPLSTASPTSTPIPIASLKGAVISEQLACRYGPGGVYLYMYGLIDGNPIEAIGRADTSDGTWLYVNFGGDRPCWVKADFVKMNGDDAGLAQVYPQQAPLLLFRHPKFPPPKNVEAQRKGDQVEIYWKGYELAPGDRESEDSPVYLVEAWTCQAGEIVFTAYGSFVESAVLTDEPGCSEPSHADVYVAHKDGYIGPVPVPWPPH